MKKRIDPNAVSRKWVTGLLGFTGLLLVLNGHLLGFWDIGRFLFLPGKVAEGQWWRLFTFPFVHVSWVHLILDAGAFYFLYTCMACDRTLKRSAAVLVCGASSLGAAWILSPDIGRIGLCGLSGIDHGLMAAVMLGMSGSRTKQRAAVWGLVLLMSKVVYETVAGDAFFSSLYLGRCGIPLYACHLGGFLGGIVSHVLFVAGKRLRTGKAVWIH